MLCIVTSRLSQLVTCLGNVTLHVLMCSWQERVWRSCRSHLSAFFIKYLPFVFFFLFLWGSLLKFFFLCQINFIPYIYLLLEWHGIKRKDSRQAKKGKQAEDLCTLCILKLNGCIIWGIRQIKAGWFCPLNHGCIQRVNQLLLIIRKILIRVLKLSVKQHMVCYLIKEVFPGYRIHSLSDKNI